MRRCGIIQTSATTAGMVFKCRVHKFFEEKRNIELSLIHCDPDAGVTNYSHRQWDDTEAVYLTWG